MGHRSGEERDNIFIYALRYADSSELDQFIRWLKGAGIIGEDQGMPKEGFIILTEKDWEKASPEQQKWYIFNTLASIDERLKKLERWVFVKACLLFCGSALGGALMMLILVTLKVKVF